MSRARSLSVQQKIIVVVDIVDGVGTDKKQQPVIVVNKKQLGMLQATS